MQFTVPEFLVSCFLSLYVGTTYFIHVQVYVDFFLNVIRFFTGFNFLNTSLCVQWNTIQNRKAQSQSNIVLLARFIASKVKLQHFLPNSFKFHKILSTVVQEKQIPIHIFECQLQKCPNQQCNNATLENSTNSSKFPKLGTYFTLQGPYPCYIYKHNFLTARGHIHSFAAKIHSFIIHTEKKILCL